MVFMLLNNLFMIRDALHHGSIFISTFVKVKPITYNILYSISIQQKEFDSMKFGALLLGFILICGGGFIAAFGVFASEKSFNAVFCLVGGIGTLISIVGLMLIMRGFWGRSKKRFY